MEHDLSERIISSRAGDNAAGQRLDRYLSERFTYRSRKQWQDMIKGGDILLNGVKTRCSRILQGGEEISFVADTEEPPVELEYSIIYEDDFFYAVNKGGNLPCHPAGAYFKNTLWYDMCSKYGKVYVVNRLDRETSGLMLMGKSPEAAAKLSELFAAKDQLSKKYYALVEGEFTGELHASGYLVSDATSEVRKKRRFVRENDYSSVGESAVTNLAPVARGDGISLVEARPETGRLHQIRATLYSLGFPLLGDKLYGVDDTIYIRFSDGRATEDDYRKLKMRRQALHAYALKFTHPFTGEELEFNAPLPEDMKSFPLTDVCPGYILR
jgi:RluA family pseudouridine synthase